MRPQTQFHGSHLALILNSITAGFFCLFTDLQVCKEPKGKTPPTERRWELPSSGLKRVCPSREDQLRCFHKSPPDTCPKSKRPHSLFVFSLLSCRPSEPQKSTLSMNIRDSYDETKQKQYWMTEFLFAALLLPFPGAEWQLCAGLIDLRWSQLHSALRKGICFFNICE